MWQVGKCGKCQEGLRRIFKEVSKIFLRALWPCMLLKFLITYYANVSYNRLIPLSRLNLLNWSGIDPVF